MRHLLLLLLMPPLLAVADTAPLPTVPTVDLARYAGAWYEIALLPNRFQKQCVADTQARYTLDGARVKVVNRCRLADGRIDDITGHAKIVDGSGNAKLRVSFFWPFYGDYWVLALDPDYRQVLVGAPSRQYAWVLSRTPQMDEAALQALLDRAEALGFDKTAFRRTPQTQPLDCTACPRPGCVRLDRYKGSHLQSAWALPRWADDHAGYNRSIDSRKTVFFKVLLQPRWPPPGPFSRAARYSINSR